MEESPLSMQAHIKMIQSNIAKVIVGKSEVIELLTVAMLAEGHVLLEDMPGLGKTVMAKSLAKSVNGVFQRIQFTPDLLPSDVTGLSIYNQKAGEFQFRKGPVFCHLLLADEINRATPRTQSSLLEAMEERQVTIDGQTHTLEQPFLVLATQNPVETQGTFPLPEAQLDRFLMKIAMGYPSQEEEVAILNRMEAENPITALEGVVTVAQVKQLQAEARQVMVHDCIKTYIVNLVNATRDHSHIVAGASPRATLALMRASKALAYIRGRAYVKPDDVKYLAPFVLEHRLVMDHAYTLKGEAQGNIMAELLKTVPVPVESDLV